MMHFLPLCDRQGMGLLTRIERAVSAQL